MFCQEGQSRHVIFVHLGTEQVLHLIACKRKTGEKRESVRKDKKRETQKEIEDSQYDSYSKENVDINLQKSDTS